MARKHWVETTLGMITTHPQYGWTTKAGQFGKYKYFRTTDINSPVNWTGVPFCVEIPKNPNDYTIKRNDILISRAGSVGLSIRFEEDHVDTLFASYLIRFRVVPLIDSKLVEYYFRTKEYWAFINESQSGIAVPNVNASKLKNLPFPLPPLNEQKRIVEKLDAILPKVKSAKARLEKIPHLLKKFRQSVLAAACSGKLTENWREGKDLPEWTQTTIREIANSMSTGPFGTMLHSFDYIENGIPVINPTNITDYQIVPNNSITLKQEKADELSRYRLQLNDVLLARRGNLSKCGIVTNKEINWIAGSGLFILRVKINPLFFKYFFSTNAVQNRLNSNSVGSTMLNLNQTILGNIELLLPTPSEQHEIVRRVEKLFTVADSLETKYQKAMEKIAKLEQAILAKAFRGELVEPDSNDEPAAELLKRLLAEKTKLENPQKSKITKSHSFF